MSKALRAPLAALLLLVAAQAYAQDPAVFEIQPDSKMWVDGTSNKSDWTVTVTELTGFVKMNKGIPAPDPGVQEVHVTVPAEKIVSNRSTIMDRLMRNALKVKEHPEITYELTKAEVAAGGGTAPNSMALRTHGRLTVAGVTREIEVPVQGEKQADGKMHFTGSHTMLMTDYDMTPPTALFGALHTGDEVVVHFDLIVGM